MTALAKVNAAAWSIAPQSVGELMSFAKLIADSELVPKDFRGKPGNVVIAIQMGADVGLSPMQSIQSIAVINGRATMWGDTLLALVQAHPDFVDIIEVVENGTATCTLKLKGRSPVLRTFSREEAKRAGLLGKQGPWTQHEARMLQMRARGFALRDGAAYILRGFGSAEEQRDIVEAKATVVTMEPEQAPAIEAPRLEPPKPAQALPTKTAKNYADKQYAEVPFASLPQSVLNAYLSHYETKLPTLTQANHIKAVTATIGAARAEFARRIEAQVAGADPATGEIPEHLLDGTRDPLGNAPDNNGIRDELTERLQASIDRLNPRIDDSDRGHGWNLEGDAP